MSYFLSAWAWFTGLSIITKLGGGLAAIGILSPVMSALTFVWTAIKAVLTWIFDGFQNVVAHPVTLSIVMLAWMGGMYQGVQWDKHQVVAARVKAAAVVAQVKGEANVEARKAAAAIAARDAAKMLPLVEPVAPVTPINADHPVKASAPTIALDPARPDSVRKPAGVRSRPKCSAVFCF